jgi:glycosyltransferase involved in cell wall biosynthesis
LRRNEQSVIFELNGVRIYRIQARSRDEKNKWDHLFRMLKFFCRSAALLTKKHLERPYDLVHVHSIPDFEVFAGLIPKLMGARVILDIHDMVPELYGNKFRVKAGSLLFKTLVMVEKASCAFSDHVIISNDLWRDKLVSRSVPKEKCTSIMNYPDITLFCSDCQKRSCEKIVLVYPGTLNHHQGIDIAIKAFAKIKDSVPEAEFHIYGEGPSKKELSGLVKSSNLQHRVFIKDPVTIDEVVSIMANCDIGIIPKRNDSFGGEAFSTKTLEFMTLGVPIIVAKTKIDQYYFDDSLVKFFEPENVEDLADAMLSMVRDKSLRDRLSKNGLEFAKKNTWDDKKHIYLDLVDELCKNKVQG